jgi:hypothetical protein
MLTRSQAGAYAPVKLMLRSVNMADEQVTELSVDDNQTYQHIPDVLNDVFEKRTKEGGEYKQTLNSYHKIREGKTAMFIWLAEKGPKGGWCCHKKDNGWLNIPDTDEKAFTQIRLNSVDEKDNPQENDKHAVFMHKKDNNGNYTYSFYGVFNRVDNNKEMGICVFKRISPILKIADWKATE